MVQEKLWKKKNCKQRKIVNKEKMLGGSKHFCSTAMAHYAGKGFNVFEDLTDK